MNSDAITLVPLFLASGIFMTENQFVDYCRSELIKSLHNAKAKQVDDKQKHRTEGLLQGARLMGILEAEEVATMIDDAHMTVFGETVKQRLAIKSKLLKLKDMSMDDYFDIPAITRS
jgi:hypothetical protein